MTVQSAPYFWVVCDRCGQRHDHEEYSAWQHEDEAEMVADDSDWWIERGNHVCPGCQPHPPDWDDDHDKVAMYGAALAPLICAWCNP